MKSKKIDFVVAHNVVSLPVRSDGETPVPLCWLVQPDDLDRGWASVVYFVEKITSDFVVAVPCRGCRGGRWCLSTSFSLLALPARAL